MLRSLVLILAAPICVVVGANAGCGPVDAVDAGRDLFEDSKISVSPSNAFSCATCHAATPDGGSANRRYSGYTLYGAAERTSYWGGKYTLMLDAVSFCLSEFMRGEKLSPTDPKGLSLLAYLNSLDAGKDAARPLTVVQNIDTTYLSSLPAGDAGRGAGLYDATCAPCHGDVHSGKGRLGSYVSIVPDDTVNVFGAMARPITIEKMRHGKFFGIGGNMPFYSREALSDAEVADLAAYLLP